MAYLTKHTKIDTIRWHVIYQLLRWPMNAHENYVSPTPSRYIPCYHFTPPYGV